MSQNEMKAKLPAFVKDSANVFIDVPSAFVNVEVKRSAFLRSAFGFQEEVINYERA